MLRFAIAPAFALQIILRSPWVFNSIDIDFNNNFPHQTTKGLVV